MSAAVRRFDPPHEPFAVAEPLAREKILRLGGAALVADPSGALYWPEERLLVAADLHLEKGSSYAARRVFLPPYDTAATLARLAAVIGRFAPRRVVALGDSFHDGGGAARMRAHDLQALRAMQVGREWLWIAGNHDPAPPAGLGGDHAALLAVGALCFRHEPSSGPGASFDEIAGHLHPVAVVGGRGGALRRRCFFVGGARCVLPAFGAYTGGLNILDPAFRALCEHGGQEPHGATGVHVLGRSAVYTVARSRCLIDSATTELSWRS